MKKISKIKFGIITLSILLITIVELKSFRYYNTMGDVSLFDAHLYGIGSTLLILLFGICVLGLLFMLMKLFTKEEE